MHYTNMMLLKIVFLLSASCAAFSPESPVSMVRSSRPSFSRIYKLSASGNDVNDGVVELADDVTMSKAAEEKKPKVSGPMFISQGEILPESLDPDFSDPKQTRVVIYTILSLLPVLFLIPFMLSRELIPLDALPPVDMSN
jgi:hypothetical protein